MLGLIRQVDAPSNIRIGMYISIEDELFTVIQIGYLEKKYIFYTMDTKTGTVHRRVPVAENASVVTYVPNL